VYQLRIVNQKNVELTTLQCYDHEPLKTIVNEIKDAK
jgi:hypothetical protein